ncbi:MAG TPA: 16S rRNA (cytosine(967)-C(5))-methyltransferase RsmB [Terriglobales bacterium]|nr:16S rRNA (cytosine(967)-C(5))-methyltransferase RsmB [Terriglobales bacterium]
MPVSPARAAAFEILLKVERENSYASELLHSTRFSRLSGADHGLATELTMGVLRWQALLDHALGRASSQQLAKLDAEVLIALRLGLYQLQFLSRIPVQAATFESVELVKSARKKSAAAFVNAVLRKLARERDASANAASRIDTIATSADSAALALNSSHPEWLVESWVGYYGLEAARLICAHNQSVPPASLHVYDDQALAEFARAGIKFAPGQILSRARTVISGDVTTTDAYRQGGIAIQDEASQLVALLVGRGESILDCCAAPGSKTALLARRNPASQIIAAELHPHRTRLLRRLACASNVHVVAGDARALPFSKDFDRILADVPCSGTGTLTRNPDIKWRLQPADLADLQSRQIAILKSALSHLAPGGRLVYSTCSLEREENEAVVEASLESTRGFKVADCRDELMRLRQSGELLLDDLDRLLVGPYVRTIPGRHLCDGFFAAIIELK